MKRLLALLAASSVLALVAGACGDSGTTMTTTTTTQASVETSVPAASTTTVAPAVVTEATTPPPSSFAEVEADYAAATAAIFALGRSMADQFLGEDDDVLFARFDDQMSSLLTVNDLAAGRNEVILQAPIGERGLERAIQLSPDLRFYGVEVAWGEEKLTLNGSFNEDDEISGLFMNPQLPLPPDPAADFESEVAFRLPFVGLWFTFWGGDTEVENYHVVAPSQRHAFDFLIWQDGGTHAADGTAVTDYWAYGQKVLAPAGGTVIDVVDGLPDQVPQTGSDPDNPAGNHVIIEVAQGQFVLLAHMQAGSLSVAEGDVVEVGQQIGLVGNSGNTTEPHIHIHLQDLPVFLLDGTGLNLEFTNFLTNGEPVDRDQPGADQFVANG